MERLFAKCLVFDLLLICIYFFIGKSDGLVRFFIFHDFYWLESLTEELMQW